MITTDFAPGAPCWLDIGAPDVTATQRFYTTCFGWDFEAYDEVDGTYGLFRRDGKAVGGVGPLTEQDARSAWMIYFNSPDIEATTRQVEDSGGTVRVAPMDVPGQARMAQFTDPQGGEFAAWQPSPNKGLESVDEPGSLTWTELYTPDADAAKAFYGRLFDWRTDDTELPGGAGTYAIISPTSGGEDRMQGGMMQVGPDVLSVAGGHAYWHPVFGTTDCDATAAAVTTNGGGVHMGPQDVEGVGRLAVCVDPFGADFVALQPERG